MELTILSTDILASDVLSKIAYMLVSEQTLYRVEDIRCHPTDSASFICDHAYTFSVLGSPIDRSFIYASSMLSLMKGETSIVDSQALTPKEIAYIVNIDSEETEETEDETVLCEVCHERFDEDDAETFDGQMECDDCLSDHTSCCDRCNERIENDDTVSFDNSYYCEDCADMVSFVCTDCDKRVDSDDQTSDHRGNAICHSCYENGDYFYCEGCSETCHPDNYGSDGNCTACSDSENEDSSEFVHNYSYSPSLRFFGKVSKGQPFYGVELEVNTYDIEDHAQYTIASLNGKWNGETHAYLKEDSSIGGGFEIVTHPHTLEEQRKLWEDFFENVPNGMTSYKSGNCGMHVHISRNALTQMQIRKMLVFLNAPENLGYVTGVAQRSDNSYCKIAKKDLTQRLSEARYEALNVTNDETVEVRIFRGTVRKDRFFKNLDFVDAMVNFSGRHNYTELTAGNFLAYVSKHRSSYKYLYNFHVEKGYTMGKPLPISNQKQLNLMPVMEDIAA